MTKGLSIIISVYIKITPNIPHNFEFIEILERFNNKWKLSQPNSSNRQQRVSCDFRGANIMEFSSRHKFHGRSRNRMQFENRNNQI